MKEAYSSTHNFWKLGGYKPIHPGKLMKMKATEVGYVKKRILWGAGIVIAAMIAILIWLIDIPSWQKLDMEKLTNLSQTTMIYDEEGQPVSEVHNGENRVVVPIEKIPLHVRNAFIAMEDARFYKHHGIDLWRIGGAVVRNIKAGSYQEGASTITQQLIKLTHLTSRKTLSRKAQEAWLALQLERQASKDEILGMYLNVVYFGKGAYGIEAAAQSYFGKSCSDLSLAEGAMLAGVIKAPGNYAPHISLERAIERRNRVIDAMLREEMISQEEAAAARNESVQLMIESPEGESGWYVDWVMKEAGEILSCSAEELLSGGYRIYTALNSDAQETAEALFEDPDYFPGNAADGIRPESALIAMDPKNGEVRCMVGGRSYETRRGLNRAMQIQRQPGSAFKPISVYAAAIDFMGYTPISLIEDVARDFGDGYMPSNASGHEYGTVTLREALVRSMNLATVDLITRTGIESACAYAERAGIDLSDDDRNLSLALGSLTEGVSPAEMSAAYAALANGGYRVEAHTIRRIEDLYGDTLYEYSADNEYVMSEKSARMITSMLEDAADHGTAKRLASIGFPVAAKTGTVGYTEGGNRDAWTVAYTPSISVAVWQGFDQTDREHLLPDGATGGNYPAKLAAAFMKQTEDMSNGGEFPIPEGMSQILLDGSTLNAASAPMLASERTPVNHLISEILPDEKLPVLTSDRWNDPKRVEAVYIQRDSSGYPAISFIATDSFAQYRIIRMDGEGQTEVGCIEGEAGKYLTFVDQTIPENTDAQYLIISRHKGFFENGMMVESEHSETVAYHAPGALERWLGKIEKQADHADQPLFGLNDENRKKDWSEM